MFEKITGSISSPNVVAIEESEAARLLFGHCRDTGEALDTLKGNPWAPMTGENCRVRWNPKLAALAASECAGENCTGCGHMAADGH